MAPITEAEVREVTEAYRSNFALVCNEHRAGHGPPALAEPDAARIDLVNRTQARFDAELANIQREFCESPPAEEADAARQLIVRRIIAIPLLLAYAELPARDDDAAADRSLVRYQVAATQSALGTLYQHASGRSSASASAAQQQQQVQPVQQPRSVSFVLPDVPMLTDDPDRSRYQMDFDIWSTYLRGKLEIDGEALGSEKAKFYYVLSRLETEVQRRIYYMTSRLVARQEWDYDAVIHSLDLEYGETI
ncbi:hypothetical protein F4820DRAFT_116164 [Hypoxylon rubiginosum]|uniref:Uncharacterized protein n=1 Tax=Hypoxylon rubiginosum TaxID=110542 RepID=A0ACB9YMC5_9PEZI|nr:hypothetical protein F4820DRAFT_116164 [Hypoxylon rubiginosum]